MENGNGVAHNGVVCNGNVEHAEESTKAFVDAEGKSADSRQSSCLSRFRSSPNLATFIVFLILTLDAMLLTSVGMYFSIISVLQVHLE